MVEANTIFGDPQFARRLQRLLEAQEEPAQLQVLVDEFTFDELVYIAQQLVQKGSAYYTRDTQKTAARPKSKTARDRSVSEAATHDLRLFT